VTVSLFGKTFGLFGASGFCLNNSVHDVGIYGFFVAMFLFFKISNTIVPMRTAAGDEVEGLAPDLIVRPATLTLA
jgi:hypothetical protein